MCNLERKFSSESVKNCTFVRLTFAAKKIKFWFQKINDIFQQSWERTQCKKKENITNTSKRKKNREIKIHSMNIIHVDFTEFFQNLIVNVNFGNFHTVSKNGLNASYSWQVVKQSFD